MSQRPRDRAPTTVNVKRIAHEIVFDIIHCGYERKLIAFLCEL